MHVLTRERNLDGPCEETEEPWSKRLTPTDTTAVTITMRQYTEAIARVDRRARELCGSRGGRPGLPAVPNSPYGLCG